MAPASGGSREARVPRFMRSTAGYNRAMSKGPARYRLSFRSLMLATAAVGIVIALVKAGHPELGLVVALPFAVGLVWGDMCSGGLARTALIATSPVVATLFVCGVLFVWELVLRGNPVRAVAGTALFSFGIALYGAVPAIAGSLLARALKRKPDAAQVIAQAGVDQHVNPL